MKLLQRFREILFRANLYFFGVRFHIHPGPVQGHYIRKADFMTQDHNKITFEFYRVPSEDILLMRGKVLRNRYEGYIIRPIFPDSLPNNLLEYHEKCFFFSGRDNQFSTDLDRVTTLIADVFIDYLVIQLAPETKPVPL